MIAERMKNDIRDQSKGKSSTPVTNDDDHIHLKRSTFSGRKKKDQLKAKRKIKESKRDTALQNDDDERTRFYEEFHGLQSTIIQTPREINSEPRYTDQDLAAEVGLLSLFQKESDQDVDFRKKDARIQYYTIAPGPLGIAVDDSNLMESVEMPLRPQWNPEDTPSEVDARETLYFQSFVEELHSSNVMKLNSFELNLEVWRQLWRVIERSDVLLIVVDIRLPQLNFPKALYELLRRKSISDISTNDHVSGDTTHLDGSSDTHFKPKSSSLFGEKSMVIVLNKVDLVSRDVADEWLDWFKKEYVGVTVLCMSNLPSERGAPFRDNNDTDVRLHKDRDKNTFSKSMRTLRPYGEENLLGAVRYELSKTYDMQSEFDSSNVSFEPSHLRKGALKKGLDISDMPHSSALGGNAISTGTEFGHSDDRSESEDVTDYDNQNQNETESDSDEENSGSIASTTKGTINKIRVTWQSDTENDSTLQSYDPTNIISKGILPQRAGERSSFVTIGFVGNPNAGKSSLINALAGRKVVSVSSTPGHTKHLQTIFLNPYTRLCDCPGLVFPMVGVPYPLQVLGGQVNIAQVRETFSTLAYVGARFPLERAYNLHSLSVPSFATHSIPPPLSSLPSTTDDDTYREEISVDIGKDLNGSGNHIEKIDTEISKRKIVSGWSGFGLAEAYAVKRGYYTRKQIPDAHRAGNEILRDLQTGKIIFAVSPPPAHRRLK